MEAFYSSNVRPEASRSGAGWRRHGRCPEKDNRRIDPEYLASAAQKAFFLSAVWAIPSVHASYFFAASFMSGQHVAGSLLAALSVFCWRRTAHHARTAMMFGGL